MNSSSSSSSLQAKKKTPSVPILIMHETHQSKSDNLPKSSGSRASAPSLPCPHLLHGERRVHVSVQRPVLGQLLLHGLAILHQLGKFLAHECRFLFGKVELTLQVGTVLLQQQRQQQQRKRREQSEWDDVRSLGGVTELCRLVGRGVCWIGGSIIKTFSLKVAKPLEIDKTTADFKSVGSLEKRKKH